MIRSWRVEPGECFLGVASMQSDVLYYRKRKAAEIAATAAATHPKVSAVHHELARIYDERIRALGADPAIELHLVSAA